MDRKNAASLPGRSDAAKFEKPNTKFQVHNTIREGFFASSDYGDYRPQAEATALDDLADGIENIEDAEDDEQDFFASDDFFSVGADKAAGSVPILPLEANDAPMTKQEALASIRVVAFHIAKSKEHQAFFRRELLHQYERRAWEPLGFATWEAFVFSTYNYRAAYASLLLKASRTERQIRFAIANLEALREYPLRRLSQYSEEHRVEIYIAAKKLAGKHPPTGKQIADAARELKYLTEKQQNGSNTSITTILHEPDNTAGNCPQIRQARRIQDTGRVQMQICDGGRVFCIWLTPEQLQACGYVPESGVQL